DLCVVTGVERAAVTLDRQLHLGDREVDAADEVVLRVADLVLLHDRRNLRRGDALLDQLLEPRAAHTTAQPPSASLREDPLGAALAWSMEPIRDLLEPREIEAASLEVVE